VSKSNINDIIKIKNAFTKVYPNKVLEIYNIIFNSNQKNKPKMNITTKEPLRKQIIIPMSLNNIVRIMAQSNAYVININQSLNLKYTLVLFIPIIEELLLQQTR